MNIELRERTEAHVRIYFEKTCDPEIQAMLPQTARTVEQAVEQFRRTQEPGANSFGRTIYADGVYVGDIWCYCIDREDCPGAMLSFCLFEKAYWNCGIMSTVVPLFLADVTERFRLTTVGAFAYAANRASIRVLEKSGFTVRERFAEDGVESVYLQLGG